MMHLSYCTNVHPAEDLDGVIAQLREFAGPAREQAGIDTLGVGLWLPAELAHQLATNESDRDRLRAVLDEQGLEVRTLNAFPYAAFHADVVKLDVYLPDWTDPRRLEYTIDAARALAALLPPRAEGSISTLPLGWREGWGPEQDAAATEAFAALVAALQQIHDTTGHTIRIAIEPEPGCILDNVDDIVQWLSARTDVIDPEFVGVCLDTCHLAVSFADPVAAVAAIHDAGLKVVKIQASAALEVLTPADAASREAISAFAEPRYVHQVRENQGASGILRVDDLDEALATLPGDGPWRVHFHVPLHMVPDAPLSATTDVLLAAVDAVVGARPEHDVHIDVETYTWAVLPEPPADLAAGIASELVWAQRELMGTRTE